MLECGEPGSLVGVERHATTRPDPIINELATPGIVLKYVIQAREMGRAVIFITHNPHHAFPVGDRFVLLKRGRMLGSYAKSETRLEQLTSLMAGAAELEELSHELERASDPQIKEVAKELAAEVHSTV